LVLSSNLEPAIRSDVQNYSLQFLQISPMHHYKIQVVGYGFTSTESMSEALVRASGL